MSSGDVVIKNPSVAGFTLWGKSPAAQPIRFRTWASRPPASCPLLSRRLGGAGGLHAFGFHREIMTSCWHSGFLSGTVARSSLGRVNANTSVALVLYSSRFVSKAAVQRKCICRAGAGRSLECVVAESTGLPG